VALRRLHRPTNVSSPPRLRTRTAPMPFLR
jgi:hypothetical protein